MSSTAEGAVVEGEAYVLYVDYQGHPAPLSECYHATASRRLSSSVDRFPSSTVTEVDSAYCPQCLASHDPASAANLGYCPKPSCQRCPMCQAICSVSTTTMTTEGNPGRPFNLCYYKCGVCSWTSMECNLTKEINGGDGDDDGSYSRVDVVRAVEELGAELRKRKQSYDDDAQANFKSLTEAWASRNRGRIPGLGGKASRRKISAITRGSSMSDQEWSVEALEAALQDKKSTLMGSYSASSPSGSTVARIPLDGEASEEDLALDASLSDVPVQSLHLQALNYSRQPRRKQDLLPLPVPLRVRKSRRCRAELAEGRPGILLKPKLNPLEGDSSLRTGHGQWWKKDSSAIHVIPRVRVVMSRVVNNCRFFLLKVTNPTLGPIRLRFTSSTYLGESTWDDDDAGGGGTKNSFLPGLLVDGMFQTRLDAELKASVADRMPPTETVELLSAEDSFIELGGKSREVPDEVAGWDPSNAGGGINKSSMRLVASSASTAWFEFVLFGSVDSELACGKGNPAIPFALQIEVGNGSWESSLVQPQPPQADGRDRVTFDLVLIWQ